MNNINSNFRYLNVGLPEDIARYKANGNIEEAVRLIDERMKGDIPEALRGCYIVQRELMLRLPRDYPFSYDEAFGKLKKAIPDFTEGEFKALRDTGRIDWIFINGEQRYFLRFFETLMKTDDAMAKRASVSDTGTSQGEDEPEEKGENKLDRSMRIMKSEGKFAARIKIRASVRIKDESFVPGARVRVHIPIPAACMQQSEIELVSFSGKPAYIAPEDAPQRTVYFEETMKENHEFFVEYSYVNSAPYCDASKVVPSKEQPDFFLEEQNPHIVFTPYIKALVEELTKGLDDPLSKARAFYDFITTNVKYSYMRQYFGLESIAENCLRNFKGDCGVQALAFITLCRAAGIPARWQSGLYAAPFDVGAHDWAQFYIAPYGWLFADPSFGGSAFRSGNEERRKHYFGNLDPYRMIANSEFQHPLDPEKAQWRMDPYDNQTGEIEYADRGLRAEEYVRDQVMTSIEEIGTHK